MKKDTLFYIILLIIILGATISWGYFFASSNSEPRILVSPEKIDFGVTKITDKVIREVMVKNIGSGLLKIIGVSTSCGCTTAKIEEMEIKPGGKTKLTVTYDPQVHKETGDILRMVYIKSNDPKTPETEIEVVGRVVE